MKFLPSQLAYAFDDGEGRRNLSALLRFSLVLVATAKLIAANRG